MPGTADDGPHSSRGKGSTRLAKRPLACAEGLRSRATALTMVLAAAGAGPYGLQRLPRSGPTIVGHEHSAPYRSDLAVPAGDTDTTRAGRKPTASGRDYVILGTVRDSLAGGGLVGAAVIPEGLSGILATTDSAGVFRLGGLPPGRYRLGVYHPLLDSLGVSLASPPVAAAIHPAPVFLATPSGATIARAACLDAATIPVERPSVVIGRVLDADSDDPVTGAIVQLIWVDIQASMAVGFHRRLVVRDTLTGPDGAFHFCGVSRATDITVRSARVAEGVADSISLGAARIGEQIVARRIVMGGRLAVPVQLHLPAMDARATPAAGGTAQLSFAGSGRVTGRVVGSNGAPLSGALVTLGGTTDSSRTGGDGQFALSGLPTGSRTLVIRAIGYEPTAVPVELSSRSPRTVTVTLTGAVPVLETVAVTAARLQVAYDRVGFTRRRKGFGYFLDDSAIARRDAFEFSDLMVGVPGFRHAYGRTGKPYLVASDAGSGVQSLPSPAQADAAGSATTNARAAGIAGATRASVRALAASQGTGFGGGCSGGIRYLVDGTAFGEMEPGDIDNYVKPAEIGAIEKYDANESPGSLGQSPSSCVTIVIWTKQYLGI